MCVCVCVCGVCVCVCVLCVFEMTTKAEYSVAVYLFTQLVECHCSLDSLHFYLIIIIAL